MKKADLSGRQIHLQAVKDILSFINGISHDYVLKGSTALLLFYGLDRFSEGLDFDSSAPGIEDILRQYALKNSHSLRKIKDTDITKRFQLHYRNESQPLKIEVSYRTKGSMEGLTVTKGGIQTYDISTLCIQKTAAYGRRLKLRDLYDISFIADRYFEELSPVAKQLLESTVMFQGLEHFDYLLETQRDELVDEDTLIERFSKMYTRFSAPDPKNRRCKDE